MLFILFISICSQLIVSCNLSTARMQEQPYWPRGKDGKLLDCNCSFKTHSKLGQFPHETKTPYSALMASENNAETTSSLHDEVHFDESRSHWWAPEFSDLIIIVPAHSSDRKRKMYQAFVYTERPDRRSAGKCCQSLIGKSGTMIKIDGRHLLVVYLVYVRSGPVSSILVVILRVI